MTRLKYKNPVEICGNLLKLIEAYCLKAKAVNLHKLQSISINFNRAFIICILVLSSQLCFAQDSAKEEEALFVAQKAFEDNFYDVSLGLLERFVKDYPNSDKVAQAQLLIGQCYFYQGKFLDALSKFNELLDKGISKDNKDALFYWIAEVHFKGNAFDKAGQYYKRIIDESNHSPYLSDAYYSLGWCLFQQAKFAQALEYFKLAQEKYPKESEGRDLGIKIIECLYNLKDYKSLKEKVRPYLKDYSKNPVNLAYLYFYLAEADYYLNNFSDAVEEYSKAAASAGDKKIQGLCELGKGWSYFKLERYQEAEESFSKIDASLLDKQSRQVFLLGKAALMTQLNKPAEAEKIYNELLSTTDDSLVLTQAYLGKAESLYNARSYPQAIDIYNQAISKVDLEALPEEIRDKFHYSLAWAYLKYGNFKEAIGEFRRIVNTSGDKVVKISALCQIGDAYQDSGDYQKAQEAYDSILRDYPDSFYSDYVQYQSGLTSLKSSNYDGAIMSFLSLKKNFPGSKLLDEVTYTLALAYFQKQDYNSSKDALERFQDEFKESKLRPDALYLLGASLYNLGRFLDAIGVFKEVIRIYGQNKELMQKAEYEIADCFYQLGDEKEAISRFKMLRSKYPDSGLTAEIMWWLGEYYYRHSDLEMAKRYLSSLIQDFSKSNLVADAYYVLGGIYEDENKHEEAIKNFKKVKESGSADLAAQAVIAMADVYVKIGDSDSAFAAYQDVLNDHPNLSGMIYPKMADLYYNINSFDRALDFYQKSLDLVPIRQAPDIQFKIAQVLQAQAKHDLAIKEYLKVTYLYSQDNKLTMKALLRVAAIYEEKENFKEALNIYRKIVSSGCEEAKYAAERIELIKGGRNGY
jgi:tetratricopeptide (TPR) repeat protein